MIYIIMIIVFVLGYLFIALEHNIKVDKAATALVTGVLTWMLYIFNVQIGILSAIVDNLLGGWCNGNVSL